MITDELIQEFICDKISSSYKLLGWKRLKDSIHIMYDKGGQTIKMSVYEEWLIEKRNDKIESILN